MKRNIVLVLAMVMAVLAAGCAANVPKLKQTASGRPEALFVGENAAKVKNKVITDLATSKFMLTDSGDNYLLFSQPMSGGAEMFAQMAYGVNTSGTWFARYIFVPQGKDTFVTVHLYMEIVKPLGKQVLESTNNETFNAFQKRLFDIGGQ